MSRLLLVIILMMMLTGCGWRVVRADPVPAQCESMCYVTDSADMPCASRATWAGDAADPKAIDALVYETIPDLRSETWTCGARLKACQQCLKRLEKAKIITLP